jgi:uroporphyrinogen-III synthase
MKNILSTKLLTPHQKRILKEAGIHLQEYQAINITPKEFQLPAGFDNYIFTSQNAVEAFIRHLSDFQKNRESGKPCFCVGEKTRLLLENNGQQVVKMSQNAADLAFFISKYHKNESFLFFCGNRRNEDLPGILTKNKLHFKEITVYDTELNPQHFSESFDGVLFFSPSGVKSFAMSNKIGKSVAFCIGNTTAKEAALYTESIIVTGTPTIENLLKKVISHHNLSLKK